MMSNQPYLMPFLNAQSPYLQGQLTLKTLSQFHYQLNSNGLLVFSLSLGFKVAITIFPSFQPLSLFSSMLLLH